MFVVRLKKIQGLNGDSSTQNKMRRWSLARWRCVLAAVVVFVDSGAESKLTKDLLEATLALPPADWISRVETLGESSVSYSLPPGAPSSSEEPWTVRRLLDPFFVDDEWKKPNRLAMRSVDGEKIDAAPFMDNKVDAMETAESLLSLLLDADSNVSSAVREAASFSPFGQLPCRVERACCEHSFSAFHIGRCVLMRPLVNVFAGTENPILVCGSFSVRKRQRRPVDLEPRRAVGRSLWADARGSRSPPSRGRLVGPSLPFGSRRCGTRQPHRRHRHSCLAAPRYERLASLQRLES